MQISMAPVKQGPGTPTWSGVIVQTVGICLVTCGNRNIISHGSSLGLDNTMTSCGSIGQPDHHGLVVTWTFGIHVAFGGTVDMDINTETACGRNMNPDMVLGSSLGMDVTMATAGSIGHSDRYSSPNNVVLRYQHGPGGGPDPWHQHDI